LEDVAVAVPEVEPPDEAEAEVDEVPSALAKNAAKVFPVVGALMAMTIPN